MNVHSLEETLIEYCSPTLAGIKTASLFSCEYHDKNCLMEDIRYINRVLMRKGICVVPVGYMKDRALMYVYRPNLLAKDLKNGKTAKLLSSLGYEVNNAGACVRCLRSKLECMNCKQEFPHEIGLFLGYPFEDVKGFIKYKGECYKCVGCWKVYGDEKEALDTFKKYKKCCGKGLV